MEKNKKEKIREAVREGYGQIARAADFSSEMGQAVSCCGTSEKATETGQSLSCCGLLKHAQRTFLRFLPQFRREPQSHSPRQHLGIELLLSSISPPLLGVPIPS